MAKTMSSNSGRRRQKGVALLIALFVLLLLSAIALGMMYASNTETSINSNFKDKQTAIYAALSGIHEARERIIPAHCGDSTTPWAICAPTDPPAMGAPGGSDKAQVLYIINPANGETVDPTAATLSGGAANPYFDTELCHENILGLTSPGSGSPCDPSLPAGTTMPASSNWYKAHFAKNGPSGASFFDDSLSAAGPFNLSSPINMKWTRIIRKTNNMGILPVDGNALNNKVLCWDGKNQIPLPPNYDPASCGPPHPFLSVSMYGTLTNCTVGSASVPCSTTWTQVPNVVLTPSDGTIVTPKYQTTVGSDQVSISLVLHGSGYTSAPIVVVTGGGPGVTTTAAATPTMAFGASVNGVSNGTINLGGQCYPTTTGSPAVSTAGMTFSFPFSGTPGSGAKGIATVGSSTSCMYALAVSASGCGNGTVATAVYSSGAGTGFSIVSGQSFTADNSGKITGNLSIFNPGTTATAGPVSVTLGGCNHVTTTPTWGYRLASLAYDPSNVGGGYTSAPTASNITGLTAKGDTSLEASVTATLGTPVSQVMSLTQTSFGAGYTTAPTVSIQCPTGVTCWTAGPGNVQATAAISFTPTYQIYDFTYNTSAGTGYANPPAVSFVCPVVGTPCGGDSPPVTLAANLGGTANLTYGLVYQLTSLGVTSTGARAITQAEVVTNVRGLAVSGALTLDGPSPSITKDPHSNNFYISGDPASIPSGDVACSQTGVVPAIGAYDDPNNPTNPTAVQDIVNGIPSGRTSNYFGSGPSPDVQNVYGSLGDSLGTVEGLQSLASDIWTTANLFGNSGGTQGSTYGTGEINTTYSAATINPGTQASPTVNYVNGDLTLSGNTQGYGTLLVTGTLTFSGNYTWHGMVFVIGTGSLQFSGGGSGSIDGSVIVANICSGAGPCNMPHGQVVSPNTALAKQGSPTYGYNGGGTNNIQYNPCAVTAAMAGVYVHTIPQSSPVRVISSRTITY